MSAAPQAVQGSALRSEVLRDATALLRLRGAWEALCEVGEAGCLFLTPEWLIPWWEQFGAGRELCCIAISEGERLLGFLPLFTEVTRAKTARVQKQALNHADVVRCGTLQVRFVETADSIKPKTMGIQAQQMPVGPSGGVQIDSWSVLNRVETRVELATTRRDASALEAGRWWWD